MTDNLQEHCRAYIDSRRSTYRFRCRRFRAVWLKMWDLGFNSQDTVVDVGAGRQDFETFLRNNGWRGRYIPIDGSIDGTDLSDPRNVMLPNHNADFYVAIELVEHLHNPMPLLTRMRWMPKKGAVLTTPNCEVVDVVRCDPDHKTVVPAYLLEYLGYNVERQQLFNEPNDSLVAWMAK